MKTKYFLLVIACGFLLSGLTVEMVSQVSSPPLKILSAKRAERYQSWPGQGSETLKPSEVAKVNPEDYVVLLVSFSGISKKKFDEITKTKKPYLQVGDQRYEYQVSGSGFSGSSTKTFVFLVAVVPQHILSFTLFVGNYPPVSFTAQEKVYDKLDSLEEVNEILKMM